MKYILVLNLFLSQLLLPTKASTPTTYLFYGDMPSVILLQIDSNEQIQVTALPTSLVLQPTCTGKSSRLSALMNRDTEECLIDTLETTLSIEINYTTYLNTKEIDNDFPQNLKGSDLQDMKTLKSYFSSLATQIDISLLWSYHKYIDTNLSLWDLKDLYPIFIRKDLSIQYRYPHLIGNDKHWYMIDKKLYDWDA